MKKSFIIPTIVSLVLTLTFATTSIAGKHCKGKKRSGGNPIAALILGAAFVSTMVATTIVSDQVEKKRAEESLKRDDIKPICGKGCGCNDHPECDNGYYCNGGQCTEYYPTTE